MKAFVFPLRNTPRQVSLRPLLIQGSHGRSLPRKFINSLSYRIMEWQAYHKLYVLSSKPNKPFVSFFSFSSLTLVLHLTLHSCRALDSLLKKKNGRMGG